MPRIHVDEATYRELELIALAWNTTVGDALARLIADLSKPGTGHEAGARVAVHGYHARTRVEATFDPASHAVTITSGPLAGRRFTTPSGARSAVVRLLNPAGSPVGNGWNFWIITATGARLRTLRHRQEGHPNP